MRSSDLVRGDPQGRIKKEIFNLKSKSVQTHRLRSADLLCVGSHRALESLRVQCQTVYARSNHMFCRAKSISMHSENILFEKLPPRGSENFREVPRSSEKLREAPTGSEKLQEAPRSSREVAWGQFDLCQMDLLVCRLEASER